MDESMANIDINNPKINELLVESGLQRIIEKYGSLSILEFKPLNKKGFGVLNLQVVSTVSSDDQFQKIFNEIGLNTKFEAFYSREKDISNLKQEFTNVHHIGMSKSINQAKWEVNVWLVSNMDIEKQGGKIDISKSKYEMFDSFEGLNERGSKTNILNIVIIIGYVLLALIVFTSTLGLLNKVINGEWGLKTQFIKEVEIPTEEEEVINKEASTTEEVIIEEEASTTEEVVLPVEEATTSIACVFENNLRIGDRNDDVAMLQEFLSTYEEGIYPEGVVSGFFDDSTKAAVIRFQENNLIEVLTPWEINQGTGFVGITTRAKLNELCKGIK